MKARPQAKNFPLSRRSFLGGGLVAGALVVGVKLIDRGAPLVAGTGDPKTISKLGAFVRIGPGEEITLMCPSSEMGQGSWTGLAMIVAEELDADWQTISVKSAPVADPYRNPRNNQQRTGGSGSVRGWYSDLRRIGATARHMLIAAAAEHWGVASVDCGTKPGQVVHLATERTLGFGALAGNAARQSVPRSPAMKDPKDFRLIGQRVARKDTPDKVTGKAQFGMDVRVPDMLYGAVSVCPTFGGGVAAYEAQSIQAMPGVHSVIEVPGGVAVLADTYWQAKSGLDSLAIKWDRGANVDQNSRKISEALREAAGRTGQLVVEQGETKTALSDSAKILEARYEVPYLAHACMEPMNCTARVTDGSCEIWAPTQNPENTRDVAAEMLGLPKSKVAVNTTFLGGGFGRRGHTDFAVQAIIASKSAGRPVQMIWSREEDIGNDFYRPATSIRFRGGLDEQGDVTAFDAKIIAESVLAQRRPSFDESTVDFDAVKNIGRQQPYAFPNIHVEHVRMKHGIPIGFWRSVGHSQNAFMRESFMDELAHAAGRDPLEFRLALLQEAPRERAVLELAASKAGWGQSPPDGRYRGLAVAESYASWVAQVAEISIEKTGIRVHKVVAAIDCGTAVSPWSVEAQVEGAMVYGLTAALWGEIEIANGAAVQSNFHDCRMLLMREMPEFEVHIIDSNAPPGGVGEPGTPPIAPAVANAVFAATGKRIRSLPFAKHDLGA